MISLSFFDAARMTGVNDSPSTRMSGVTTTGRIMKQRQGASWVWDHFSKNKDSNSIVCIACVASQKSKPVSYSLSSGTSTLARHLRSAHKIGPPDECSSDATQSVFTTSGNVRLPDLLKDEDRARILKALVQFVAEAKQPFSIVDKKSFAQFCRALNPRYKLPSRPTLCRAIHDEYVLMHERFFQRVQSINSKVALTADGWSSRRMRGYFVITMHWIDEFWKLNKSILEFTYFPSPHTASTTSSLIFHILTTFKLLPKVQAITTDSGSEMAPAMVILRNKIEEQGHTVRPDWHVRCICHIMNRAVKDCEDVFAPQVEKLRELLKKIRATTKLREQFKPLQIALGIEEKATCDVPSLDVETRWNTMFLMVKACVKHRNVFTTMCNTAENASYLGNQALSTAEWDVMNHVCTFLERAFRFTRAASGSSYVTVSFLPLIYDALSAQCLKLLDEHGAKDAISVTTRKAADALLTKLTKYKFTMWSELTKTAQILDPRISSSNVTSEDRESFRIMLETKYGYKKELGFTGDPGEEETDISMLLNEARNARNELPVNRDEVAEFFEFTKTGDATCKDVMGWWKSMSGRFPHVSKCARDILMITGSSVASESAFSDSGDILTAERASMTDSNVSELMKLRSWFRLFD